MAVTAAIHSDQFVTIELLYPFTGINADYYCEDGNLLSAEIPHKIQEFAEQICRAYWDLATKHQSFLDFVEHAKLVYPTETIKEAIHRFLEIQFEATLKREYFSSASYDLLFENYHLTLHSGAFASKDEPLVHQMELQLEKGLKSVITSNVTEVIIFPYLQSQKSDVKVVTLDLTTEEIPEEKLLQELIISSPLFVNAEERKAIVSKLLVERFNTFTDQKKLKLFMLRNVRQDLFLYNNILETWWMQRY